MFGKVKHFAMRKLLEKQLKDAPAEQKDMILGLLEKDPQLLEKIAKEMQAEMKAGANQMNAAMKVLPKYQKQLFEAMSPEMRQKMIDMQQGGAGKFNPNGTIRR